MSSGGALLAGAKSRLASEIISGRGKPLPSGVAASTAKMVVTGDLMAADEIALVIFLVWQSGCRERSDHDGLWTGPDCFPPDVVLANSVHRVRVSNRLGNARC